MEKVRFAPKDARIIKDNPGRSPYELKELGVSDNGFVKLMSLSSIESEIESDPTLEAEENVTTINSSLQANMPQLRTKLETDKESGISNQQDLIPTQLYDQPLIAKITTFEHEPQIKGNSPSHPNQVIVRTPTGRVNLMGREFALKLIRQNAGYTIIG